MDLNIKKNYPIVFKKQFSQKGIIVNSFPSKPKIIQDDKFRKKLVGKLQIFEPHIRDISLHQYINFRAEKNIARCNVCVYKIIFSNDQESRIMEIIDIDVGRQYRSKGIGSQILLAVEEITRNNKISCIIGELQEDKAGEPLYRRKKFFKKNGYLIWKDDRADFSGWVTYKLVVRRANEVGTPARFQKEIRRRVNL